MADDTKTKLTYWVTLSVTITLCLVIVCMVATLMVGLFNKDVDNAEIFKLISPAFQTIIGGFIGLLAGVKLSSDSQKLTSEQQVIDMLLKHMDKKVKEL